MKVEQLIPKEEAKRWPWYKTWAKALFFPNLETAREILLQANISFQQAIVWNGAVAFLYYLIVNFYSSLSQIFSISLKVIAVYIGDTFSRTIIALLVSFGITGITHSFARLKRDGSFVEYYGLFTAFSVPFGVLFNVMVLLQRIAGFELFNLVIYVLSFLWLFAIGLIPARAYYHLGWRAAFLVSIMIPYGLIFSCYFLFFVLNPEFLQKIRP